VDLFVNVCNKIIVEMLILSDLIIRHVMIYKFRWFYAEFQLNINALFCSVMKCLKQSNARSCDTVPFASGSYANGKKTEK